MLPAIRSLSQAATSFIGFVCQGIHYIPFVPYYLFSFKLKPVFYPVFKEQKSARLHRASYSKTNFAIRNTTKQYYYMESARIELAISSMQTRRINQLCYDPTFSNLGPQPYLLTLTKKTKLINMGQPSFELGTSVLSGLRSNQLS